MDSTPAPGQPVPSKLKWILLFAGLLIGLSLLISINLILNKRPQLDLKNTGTTSVTVVFEKHMHDLLSGNTWHERFDAGDTISFSTQAPAPGAGLTVNLDTRTQKGRNPPRVAAEVNADVPAQVRFEYK